MRIAVDYRYHADFLLPLYGQRKSVKRFSDRLAGLQNELGAYNDMATTASLLGGLGAVSSDSFTASAAISGWQAHAMTGAKARLQDAWRGFSENEGALVERRRKSIRPRLGDVAGDGAWRRPTIEVEPLSHSSCCTANEMQFLVCSPY